MVYLTITYTYLNNFEIVLQIICIYKLFYFSVTIAITIYQSPCHIGNILTITCDIKRRNIFPCHKTTSLTIVKFLHGFNHLNGVFMWKFSKKCLSRRMSFPFTCGCVTEWVNIALASRWVNIYLHANIDEKCTWFSHFSELSLRHCLSIYILSSF